MLCVVEGCDKPMHVKKVGLCQAHYLRWRRRGTLELTKVPNRIDRAYLLARVEVGLCWRWLSTINNYGYGLIGTGGRGGRLWLAHRLTYTLWVGPIPHGHVLHHLCGNRWCVNPRHLEPMIRADHARLHASEGVLA